MGGAWKHQLVIELDPVEVAIAKFGGAWFQGNAGKRKNPLTVWDKVGIDFESFLATVDGPRDDDQWIHFDGTQYMDGAAVAQWNRAHQEGALFFALVRPSSVAAGSSVILDNFAIDANNSGFAIYRNSTSLVYRVGNATGTYMVNASGGVFSASAWHLVEASFSVAAGFRARIDDQAPITGSLTGSPSVADASFTMRLGERSNVLGQPWGGRMGDIVALRKEAIGSNEAEAVRVMMKRMRDRLNNHASA